MFLHSVHKASSGGFRRSPELPTDLLQRKTYAKGRLLPRGMRQMAGSPCRAQTAYPGGAVSGSWKQSSGNDSWPTSPSHADKSTPFWAVNFGGWRGQMHGLISPRNPEVLFQRGTLWPQHCTLFASNHWCLTQSNFLILVDADIQMVTWNPPLPGTCKPTTATTQQNPIHNWLAGGAEREWSDSIKL